MTDEETPPRYQPRGNFKELVTDEREWLARPAPWGIGYLPESVRERKWAIFQHHHYRSLLARMACDACRPVVGAAFAEGGFEVPGEFHHADCDAVPFQRFVRLYHRHIVEPLEVLNKFVEYIHNLTGRDGPSRAERIRADRELALELVGPNPFRPVALDPAWLTSTVARLAATMYERRDFAAMPILADALQEAGCDNEPVLAHCRGDTPHVRGCWVVDLVLGKA